MYLSFFYRGKGPPSRFSDIDDAVELFTNMFKSVLNEHAPWSVFQLRKNYALWSSDSTLQMSQVRDEWKRKARNFSVDNRNVPQ